MLESTPVRGEIAHLDATWRAVLERRTYPAPLERLLGEMMAAAALLSATLKFEGSLIMQMQGSGPVQLLVVEATSEHRTMCQKRPFAVVEEVVRPAHRLSEGLVTFDSTPSTGQEPEPVTETVAQILRTDGHHPSSRQLDR